MNENYGFEKLYSQGLSIRTPLNIDYQIQAIKIIKKRNRRITIKDMVGEDQLQIKKKIKIGKKINKYKLDPTLNWEFAEIINLNDSYIRFSNNQQKK